MREETIINKAQSKTTYTYKQTLSNSIAKRRRRRRKIEDTAKQREKFDKILKSWHELRFFATTTIDEVKLASQTLVFAHKVMKKKKSNPKCAK